MKVFSQFKRWENITFMTLSCIIMLLLFTWLGFNYKVFIRLLDSTVNLFNSFMYYISFVIESEASGFETIYDILIKDPQSNNIPLFPVTPGSDALDVIWANYAAAVFNLSYFKFTFFVSSKSVTYISAFILFAFVGLLMAYIIKTILFSKVDADKKGYTKTYNRFNNIGYKIKFSVKSFVIGWLRFASLIHLKIVVVTVLLLTTNTVALALDILAYFLLLISSFNPFYMYELLFVILYTYWPILLAIPPVVTITAAYFVFDYIRLRLGVKKLKKFEEHDLNFVDNVGLVNFIDGQMGTGKTTFLTDLAVTKEQLNRRKLEANLYKLRVQFPNFNPTFLEAWIFEVKKNQRAFNTTQLSKVLYDEIRAQKPTGLIFGYELKHNSTIYFNGIKKIKFTKAIEVYAHSFFYYSSDKSYIYGNYAITSKLDAENFEYAPAFGFNFFDINQEKVFDSETVYCHVVDMNGFRLEKKKINKEYESNYSDSIYTFGVVAFTELDKEFGNMIANRRFDVKDDGANPLNDGSNLCFRMIRHFSTIDYEYYVTVFADMQRFEDLSVGYLDIAQMMISICEKKRKNALPLFHIEFMLLTIIAHFRNRMINGLNNVKNMFGMFYYVLNTLAFFERLLDRRMNHFAYSILKLKIVGSDKPKERIRYYLMDAKIFADRFSTDTHKKSVEDMLLKAKGGLETDITYKSLYASKTDLIRQNSYFVERLQSLGIKKTTKRKKKVNSSKKSTKDLTGKD